MVAIAVRTDGHERRRCPGSGMSGLRDHAPGGREIMLDGRRSCGSVNPGPVSLSGVFQRGTAAWAASTACVCRAWRGHTDVHAADGRVVDVKVRGPKRGCDYGWMLGSPTLSGPSHT